jgi:primase-polymerase (primpol)-like protein
MNLPNIDQDPKWLIPNFGNIPDDLKQQPWAVWVAEPRSDKAGKYNKAPRSPVTNFKIGANQPHLFGTFEQARAAYESGNYTGIGVLLTGNGIVGFDIDDYVTTFANKPDVKAWVEQAISDQTNPAYAELSPSGTGLRLFVRGELPAKGRKAGSLEVYDNERFLTITGSIYEAR